MAIYVDFPVRAVPILNPAIALSYYNRPGHQATNGMRRSLGRSGAAFRLAFTVRVTNQQQARAIRAFCYNIEADLNLARIKFPDVYAIDGAFAQDTRNVRNAHPIGIPFSTGAPYSTGVGHAIPTMETKFRTSADLNDRFVEVTETAEIPAGCAITIGGFCYGIAGSWVESGLQRLKLSPPLRKPEVAGGTINLAPIFVGVCVTETPGFEALESGRWGDHQLEFVEDLTRLVEDVD